MPLFFLPLILVKLCRPSSDKQAHKGEPSASLLPKGEKFSHFVNDSTPHTQNQPLRVRSTATSDASNISSCGRDSIRNCDSSLSRDQKGSTDNLTHQSETENASSTSAWKPLVLIIPLRLGLTEINPIYFDSLRVGLYAPLLLLRGNNSTYLLPFSFYLFLLTFLLL